MLAGASSPSVASPPPSVASLPPPAVLVGYVTDIEGNLDYFNRWVERSEVLKYTTPDTLDFVQPKDSYFVFGGDAMDRGDGSIRFTERLVSLKRRHPERVFLLAGNRDLNKIRFTSEFSATDLARPADSIPRPHWDPNAPTLADYLAETGATDSRVERMRYYLKHTLGCPNTFENRRRELALLASKEEVSDEEVVDSLLADVAPGGVLRSYLEHACLAVILGNTIFVHGALDRMSKGLCPIDTTRFNNPTQPQEMRSVVVDDAASDGQGQGGVHAWAAEMNAVMQRGLAANLASPDWDSTRQTRGGEVLMALQNRCAMWGRTIVSGAYADGGCITSERSAKGRAAIQDAFDKCKASGEAPSALWWEGWNSDPRDEEVAQWLLADGIRRIVVGHKPSGDSPAVLSAQYTGVEIISADTSYAEPADRVLGRGEKSLAGVTLRGPSLEQNAARVFGVLRDGREHEAVLDLLDSKGPSLDVAGDGKVGRELEEGWWVKARMVRDPEAEEERGVYLCCRGAGRDVEYRDLVV